MPPSGPLSSAPAKMCQSCHVRPVSTYRTAHRWDQVGQREGAAGLTTHAPQAAQADTTLQPQEVPEPQPRQQPLVQERPEPTRRTQAAERTEDAAPLGRTIRNQAEQPGTRPVEAESAAPRSEKIAESDRPRAGSIDPRALTLDPSLFQFRSTLDNPTGVNQ